ncbi:hypothetical protein [Rhizobium phage RHph_X3_15]|nr:hypothetical protein [Rhizobium phage RHph_X3_15]
MARTLIIHGILKSSGQVIQLVLDKKFSASLEHHNITQDIHKARSSNQLWAYKSGNVVSLVDVSALAQINVLITEDKV